VIRGLGSTGASFGTVTRAVKDGIELLGLGFELCMKGAGQSVVVFQVAWLISG
jgi:hypothetical protein